MLALKDRDHYVRGTTNYLAATARVTPDECQMALEKLAGPDAKSHNQKDEGRRIRVEPGGWTIINGDYYQNRMSWKERREYNRQKQAEYRKRKKERKLEAEKEGGAQAIREGLARADASGVASYEAKHQTA